VATVARTAEGTVLTRRQRADQLGIRAGAVRDLARLWRVVNPVDLTGTFRQFVDPAQLVVAAHRTRSAESAADYFGRFRLAEGIDDGGILRVLAEALGPEVIASVLRGAGLGGIIHARRRGFSPQAAARNGLVKVSGAAAKLVLDGGRETVVAMSGADPRAQGWRRVTSSQPCDFCRTLGGRVFSAG
jgi:hypothetical protein